MRTVGAYRLAFVGAILSMIGSGAVGATRDYTPFMAVGGQTAQPIGHHEFCLQYVAECNKRSTVEARVKLTPERWNTLVAVNGSVNTTIIPATDQEMYGKAEVWAFPSKKGDCEDLALLKRKILIARGWAVGALLMTVVRQANGDGHAVLTVLTDRGDLVLDNLNPHILTWNETPYQFVKRQSEFDTGKWVAIEDAHLTEVGSLQN